MGKNYVNDIRKTLSVIMDEYIVNYHLNDKVGKCGYKKFTLPGKNKPIRTMDYLLINVDMVEIIDEINKQSPLSEDDLDNIQRQIREDSLEFLKNSQ
jgi:hypothetical protein